MKNKINRFLLADKIRGIIGVNAKEIKQEGFLGKNFYLLGNSEDNYQLEFIPQTKKYFFTIRFTGLIESADRYHQNISEYLKSLKIERNIVFCTESQTTII